MTNYARGRAFEYRVRDDLRKRGYVVIRSAQSKGSADLVAIRQQVAVIEVAAPKPWNDSLADDRPMMEAMAQHWILFVQCKLSSGAVAPKEWNALYALAGQAGAVPVLAIAGGRGASKAYYILTAEKDGKGGKQPMREFEP